MTKPLSSNSVLEVLAFLYFDEVGGAPRAISRHWSSCANDRRAQHHAQLGVEGGCVARIAGLQSAAGQLVNDKIGAIVGYVAASGRYAIAWQRADGSTIQKSIKPRNLVPLCAVALERVAHRYDAAKNAYLHRPLRTPLGMVTGAYGSYRSGRIDIRHGVAEDMALMIGRWQMNESYDNVYDRSIPLHQFLSMNRGDPRMYKVSTSMWTRWEMSCGDEYNHQTVRELIEATLVTNVPAVCGGVPLSAEVSTLDVRRRLPAPRGEAGEGPLESADRALLGNLLRFLRTWGSERVSGPFYVVRDAPNGTLLVEALDYSAAGHGGGTADDAKRRVYLALGGNSRIGELTMQNPINRRTPHLAPLVQLTLLPMLHFYIYDGIIGPVWQSEAHYGRPTRKALDKIVDRALLTGSIITCSERWSSGEWQRPSAIDLVDEVEKRSARIATEIHAHNASRDAGATPTAKATSETEEARRASAVPLTKKQRKLALKIIKAVERARQRGGDIAQGMVVIRRMGYTARENPGRAACLLHSITDRQGAGGALDFLTFRSKPLTYTLNEALHALAKQSALPPHISVDEISVIAPLKRAIAEAAKKQGSTMTITVEYYAPPSAEETAFANTFGSQGGW